MARGVNKVILVGTLGADPEVRYTPSGKAVANVSIATSEKYKDKNTGQDVEKTEWHRLVFWNRLAEIVGEYLKKGKQIYVEGKLTTEKWQADDGTDRYTTKIVCHEMQMLGTRGDGQGGQQGGGSSQKSGAGQSTGSKPDPYASLDDFDDDIPF